MTTSSFRPYKAGNQSSADDIFLWKIDQLVERKMEDPRLSVNDFCEHVFLSYSQVYRKIKALTGRTPSMFIRSRRLQRAKRLLESSQMKICEVAWLVGFDSHSYFSRAFHQEYGIAPSAVRFDQR